MHQIFIVYQSLKSAPQPIFCTSEPTELGCSAEVAAVEDLAGLPSSAIAVDLAAGAWVDNAAVVAGLAGTALNSIQTKNILGEC
eukprot:CAMPEP_0170781626 /NCGR_PEP_ID=MMETSP0733-20121128/14329_1 /TAXON_ID=186038 /ORGANISM="Fragilariopsis kerguelensis, Strain L26-C5" /LENGTH=83 /DNA_ID=CAMNT_0011125737 /DNA_START=56 /DNA_END=307 /DNA_ORIENTATION=+